jgi:hypothetical protein
LHVGAGSFARAGRRVGLYYGRHFGHDDPFPYMA